MPKDTLNGCKAPSVRDDQMEGLPLRDTSHTHHIRSSFNPPSSPATCVFSPPFEKQAI